MCLGCKADHARDWAIRCYHEAQFHDHSCFVTLTYDSAHLPPSGTLNKRDLQLFFKKFRKAGHTVRYFAAGEYGTKKGRPHYHAILFGYRARPDALVRVSEKGHPQWRDDQIQKAWHYGEATWGAFHPSTASYVAAYTADKLKSFAADEPDPETGLRPYEVMDRDGVIMQLQPEFQLQSLKPAIGYTWLQKYWRYERQGIPATTLLLQMAKGESPDTLQNRSRITALKSARNTVRNWLARRANITRPTLKTLPQNDAATAPKG